MSKTEELNSESVKSLLRVMDVASELKRQRERASSQLEIAGEKEKIREKIKATAQVTGESLSEGEINAAIESFYKGLYRFKKPERNFNYWLARVYIARSKIALYLLLPLLLFFLLFSSFGAYSGYRESSEEAARLAESYEIHVLSRAGKKSGIDRYYLDDSGKRVSGYYLILEARDAEGKVLKRKIRSREDGSVKKVASWAERVPEKVYQRVAEDKREDGVVDDSLYARKKSGVQEEEVVMRDSSGEPLQRMGQIHSW